MAANLDAVTGDLEAGLIPDESQPLGRIAGELPDLFRTLTRKADELSIWAGGMGLAQISDWAVELARDCGKAAETAEELALLL